MSRYGWSRSPYSSQPGGVPTVTEDDYAYITSQDLDDAGLGPSEVVRRPYLADTEGDVIIIKCRGVNWPAHFPHLSIDKGKLEVHDIAERAGLLMELSEREVRSMKLIYKGHQLKAPMAPVRDYGVKNNSIVMAILPDFDDRYDISDEEMVVVNESKTQRKNRRRKEAKRRPASNSDTASSPRDSNSNGGAKSPSPVPGAAGQRRIDELANEFATKWESMCKAYIAKPPADSKKRHEEHTRLSETILQHIVLKLDEVDTEGNPDVRQSRKDLIRTVQDMLKQVDIARDSVSK